MKQTLKTILYGLFLFSILSILFISTAAAETTVEYTIEPETPVPLSQVTVTAEIDGEEGITSVWLQMQECTAGGVCYSWDTNVSMDKSSDTSFQTDITLEHDDAAYFSLRLSIERNDEWEVPE